MTESAADLVVAAVRQHGPAIESAVKEIKDGNVRGAVAGAAMGRILANIGGATVRENVVKFAANAARPVLDQAADEAFKSETQRRIMEIAGEGFFREPRLPGDVQNELRVRGFHHNAGDIRMSLLRLARRKLLRRIEAGGGSKRSYQYADI